MSLRKFLGALALGLPAASLAHILSFGGGHSLGGSAHQLVLDASLGAFCATMAALLIGAISFASGRREGSIVAISLASFLPGLAPLALAASAWFALIEAAEPSHGLSLAAVGATILLASLGLRAILVLCVGFVAKLAVAICTQPFAALPIVSRLRLVAAPATALCPVVATRFSRPPPHIS